MDPDLELSDRDLQAIVRLVYEKSGITLHDGKRPLVVARLQKRLRAGGFASFAAYLRARQADDASGDELTALLDAIATNHTSFFREPQHFDFLAATRGARVAGAPRRHAVDRLERAVLDRRGGRTRSR